MGPAHTPQLNPSRTSAEQLFATHTNHLAGCRKSLLQQHRSASDPGRSLSGHPLCAAPCSPDSPTADEKEPRRTGTCSESMSTYNVWENTRSAKGLTLPGRPGDGLVMTAAGTSYAPRPPRRVPDQREFYLPKAAPRTWNTSPGPPMLPSASWRANLGSRRRAPGARDGRLDAPSPVVLADLLHFVH